MQWDYEYPERYPIAEAGNVKIYKSHRKEYDSFPEKYFKEKSKERDEVNALCEKYPKIEELADLCHTVANFMPCPSEFNSVKGLLSDVRDYFPLMIDKIQQCINDGTDLKDNDSGIFVHNQKIKDWHSFFIKNQEKYCLSMYYTVNDDKLCGIPLFKEQSLSRPCPMKEQEVERCLRNMVQNISNRADLILKKYNEEPKSNK